MPNYKLVYTSAHVFMIDTTEQNGTLSNLLYLMSALRLTLCLQGGPSPTSHLQQL